MRRRIVLFLFVTLVGVGIGSPAAADNDGVDVVCREHAIGADGDLADQAHAYLSCVFALS